MFYEYRYSRDNSLKINMDKQLDPVREAGKKKKKNHRCQKNNKIKTLIDFDHNTCSSIISLTV